MWVRKEFVQYYYWWVGAFALVLAMAFHIWQRPAPLRNLPLSGSSFVVVGDAIGAGVGASTPELGFVAQLGEILGKPFVNLSQSGQTTYHSLERFQNEIAAKQPNLVLVVFGESDDAQGIPNDTSLANYTKLIQAAQMAGAFVAFVGIDPPESGWRFRHYESTSRSQGVLYIPKALEGVWGKAELMRDPHHPNDRGHRILAERVAAAIKPYLIVK